MRRFIRWEERQRRVTYRERESWAHVDADGILWAPGKHGSNHYSKWPIDGLTLIIWHWLLTRHETAHPAPFNKTRAGYMRRQERRFKLSQRGFA